MVIGIDNGNANTKTLHTVFNSGLIESSTAIPMAEDCIQFDETYYYLSSKRAFFQKDKTQDVQCFILTLFGIAKELAYSDISADKEYYNVELAVGLPPLHYSSLKKKFGEYFLSYGPMIDFKYNGKDVKINLNDVKVYPQAYSAIANNPELKSLYSRIYVIDIGGYTTDVVGFRDNRLDAACCFSLENGIITMCNSIKLKVATAFDEEVEESDITDVISGKNVFLSSQVVEYIKKEAEKYTHNIINQLREFGVNAKTTQAVFVGGGSVLLEEYIQRNSLIKKPVFIRQINCNALGYTQLSMAYYKQKGKNPSK